MVVQIEAAEAAQKEALKAKKKKPGNAKSGGSTFSNSHKDQRRIHRSGTRDTYRQERERNYERGTLLSTKSQTGSVAVIIRPVRGRACIEQQRLISTEDGLVYSPVVTRCSPGHSGHVTSPDQVNMSRDTQWKYKKVPYLLY